MLPLFRAAEEINMPLLCKAESNHAGDLSGRGGWVEIDAAHTTVEVLKRSEDGRGFVMRLLETDGKEERIRVSLPTLRRAFDLTMHPFEIKTLKIVRSKRTWTLVEADCLENSLRKKATGRKRSVTKRRKR